MTNYDVCVIGGGPSGAAIARRLAQFGYTVVIVEKEVFPRRHVGISMSQGVFHWLDVLGVRKEVEQAGFLPATSTVVLWESDVPVTKESTGFNADRGVFDQILLNAALAAGADLIQPCPQIFLEENSEWKIKSASFSITAKFIVEATGRRSVLKGTKAAYLPSALAAYAYWDVNIDASYIEAGENHWYWATPVGRDKLLACIFSDPKDIKNAGSIKNHYHEKMKDFSLLFPQLQHANFSDVSVCSATAYADEQLVAHNYIKVGDAAFSTDPLSAQGVQKALKTAVQGAIVVNTILSCNANIAMEFYREMIKAEVLKNAQWTRQHYNNQKRYTGGEFWQKRKDTTTLPTERTISIKKTSKLYVNPNAVIIIIPIISGMIIKQEIGITIKGINEPFVFIHNFPIVELTSALHNKVLIEGLQLIQSLIPASDPLQVLKWLFYKMILVNEAVTVISIPADKRPLYC